MKRSAFLITLSREHHTALVWAKRAQRGSGEEATALMPSLVGLFERELAPHFAAEEADLLPLLHAHGQAALAARTLAEHATLRAEAARLRDGCAAALAPFGRALADHVRFEERELFPVIESILAQRADAAAPTVGRSTPARGDMPEQR
ncbi:hemerythrin domain-containing protein [Propionivibrio dicarboxylicus]|uniref:Hemerythrin HHE cation binding domain-containing protein n=1 Tax=Propionivibrio dicarboxylicus TaxID=83767 RepID=A0A1G8GNW8_9RHOO|nr:hemerythrin domain-containing protein [Propionivibrio dicarboxylicus]SDH96168.1 Hemerythrin HHE cation binding domain-containing protein [Propionivibrio dicarboxylicus]